MSLDYDLRKIPLEIRTVVKDDGQRVMSNETYAIIWGCLSTRIGEITEENWAEWYARWMVWQGNEEPFLKPKDVRNHIGLKTNVFPEMSRTKWLRECVGSRMNDMIARVKRETVDLDKQVKEIQKLL